MTPWLWLALTCSNLFWAANALMNKHLLLDFTPWQVAWIRYTSAGVGLAILAPILLARGIAITARPRSTRDAITIFFLGFLPFCIGPLTNVAGLNASQASESSLLVALEPLTAAALAALFLGERLTRGLRWAWASATTGFLLLSGAGPARAATATTISHFEANALIVCAQLCEGAYSVLGKRLSGRYPPAATFAMGWFAGWTCLTLAILANPAQGLPALASVCDPAHWSLSQLGAALWLGAVGSTGGYLLWLVVLERAPVSAVAMTLFIQPIAGSLLGIVFLHESLAPLQWLGGLLIVGALVPTVAETLPSRSRRRK